MTTINITALRHSAFYTPLLMTIAGGFLKEEGLEPQYTPATADHPVNDQLMDGDAHLAQSAVATSFADLEQGRDVEIVHFAQINSRDGFFLASRKPQKNFNWQDLQGKSVLVDHFFQPMAMLKYGLHRQGMSLGDFEVIDAGDVVAIERAFRQGQGDYVHMQGPAPQQLEFEGVGHVVASVGSAVGPVAFSSLCARRDWLKTDMALAFLRAYHKSLAYVNSAQASDIAAQEQAAGFFTKIHPDVLTSTITSYQALGTWQHDGRIGEEEYENLLNVFEFSGHVTRRHPYGAAIAALG